MDVDGEADAVWTPAREHWLTDLFRECTFLYNKNTPGFRKQNKKDMAFAKIGIILGVTGKEISLKCSKYVCSVSINACG